MSEITKNKIVQEFLKGGVTKAQLARKYGVSPRSVSRYTAGLKSPDDKVVAAKAPAKKTTGTTKVSVTARPVANTPRFTKDALGKLGKDAQADWLPENEVLVDEEIEYRVLATSKSVTLTKIVDEKVVGSVTADKTSPMFAQVLDGIKQSGLSQDYLAVAWKLLQPAEALKELSFGNLSIDITKNKIMYANNGNPVEVHNSLGDRIIKGLRSEGKQTSELKKMVAFLNNLMENTSFRAVNELYGFLEHTDIEITDDGHFLAWKKVRSNYFDIHSNTMRNAPGDVLSVPRNMVDEDSNRTCSYGLHVCSKGYLPSFSSNSSTDRVVKVKINPKDCVSVPTDYSNQKLRCCGYVVLEDVTGKVK